MQKNNTEEKADKSLWRHYAAAAAAAKSLWSCPTLCDPRVSQNSKWTETGRRWISSLSYIILYNIYFKNSEKKEKEKKNSDLLYSTGNYTQYLLKTYNGK